MPGSDRPNVLKVAQSVPGAWPTIPALMRLMSSQATFEPVSAKTQPVSGHTTCQIPDIENSCSRDSSRKTPPRWEAPDFPRQRPAHCPLTLGNVGGSPTPGNHTAETALAGWGARIRTWEWRNRFVRRRDRACRSHGHRPRQGAALFMGRAGEQHWVPAIRVFRARGLHAASGQDESIRARR
jgi:hypothetical protein